MRLGLFLGVALMASTIFGCFPGLDAELDKMTVVMPPESLVEANRSWVRGHANFECPPISTHAYVLAEINLATNATRAGIRCK